MSSWIAASMPVPVVVICTLFKEVSKDSFWIFFFFFFPPRGLVHDHTAHLHVLQL